MLDWGVQRKKRMNEFVVNYNKYLITKNFWGGGTSAALISDKLVSSILYFQCKEDIMCYDCTKEKKNN